MAGTAFLLINRVQRDASTAMFIGQRCLREQESGTKSKQASAEERKKLR